MNNSNVNPQYMQYLLQQLSPNNQGQVASNNPYVQLIEQGILQPQNNTIAYDPNIMQQLYKNPQSNPNINQNAIPQNYNDYRVDPNGRAVNEEALKNALAHYSTYFNTTCGAGGNGNFAPY